MMATTPATSNVVGNLSNNSKLTHKKKNVKVLTTREIEELIANGICSQCYKKDSIIYPGSSFRLCIECDKKKAFIKKGQENLTEDQLIELGICPNCHKEDSILKPGSLFRTCIQCDIDNSLIINANGK